MSNTQRSVSCVQSTLVTTFCRHETKKQKAEPVVPQRRKTNQEKVSLSGSVHNSLLFSLPATCSKACLSHLTACLSACLSACPTPSMHLMWCLSRPSWADLHTSPCQRMLPGTGGNYWHNAAHRPLNHVRCRKLNNTCHFFSACMIT